MIQPENPGKLPFSKSRAYIIGINAYQHISPLSTAVNDARMIATVLERRQGFEVSLLTDPGAVDIRRLLQEMSETVTASDRAFFYFAGHGIAEDSEGGPAGYLVPADADPVNSASMIPMADLHAALNALPCRHLLVVLDCCFSGAFKWSGSTRGGIRGKMPKRIYQERFDRFLQEKAWQVLTSAAHDQKALDVLKSSKKPLGDRGIDVRTGEHSPFARALFEGLEGKADVVLEATGEGDGVITATDLYVYIRDQVEPASLAEAEEARQTPGFFPLGEYDKGEFIFLHPRHRLNLPPTPNRNPYMGLSAFSETDRELFYGRDRVIETLRRQALARFMVTEKTLQDLTTEGFPAAGLKKLESLKDQGFLDETAFLDALGEWFPDTAEQAQLIRYARVTRNRLLVVSAVSGAGKSSVIKAGLLPRLRREGYRILPVMRPGEEPLEALEKCLNEQIYRLNDASIKTMEANGLPGNLLEALEKLRGHDYAGEQQFTAALRSVFDDDSFLRYSPAILSEAEKTGYFTEPISLENGPSPALLEELSAQKTVLIIDQYEELLTRCQDESARMRFMEIQKTLLDAVPAPQLLVVVTVRSDFEPQLDKGSLEAYWREGRCSVPWFTVDELREVIVMPTLQEVLIFDPPELVNDIIDEVIQSTGALPLLSFTLSELYLAYKNSGRQDRALKGEDYERLGGVLGSLRTRADHLYQSLDEAHRDTMRKIMLRMVSLEGGEIASRRVLIDELVYRDGTENQQVGEVLRLLVDARLVVRGTDSAGRGYAEPAHDALVKAWGTLWQWVKDLGEDNILLGSKLNAAANDYLLNSRDVKYLWDNDPRLEVLKRILNQPRHWYNEKELEFVEKSVRRKRDRTWRLRAIVAAVMAALTALTIWAVIERDHAIREANIAKSNLLAIKSGEMLDKDNTEALRLAGAAYHTAEDYPPPAALQILSDAFHSQAQHTFYAARLAHEQQVYTAVFSADGQQILTASADGSARLWDRRGSLLRIMPSRDYARVRRAGFIDAQRIYSVSETDILLWDRQQEAALPDTLKHPAPVAPGAVVLLPENKLLTGASNRAFIWNISESTQPPDTLLLPANISAAILLPDERILTTAGSSVLRWNWRALSTPPDTLAHDRQVSAAAALPDGRVLTAADTAVYLWDAEGQRLLATLPHRSRVQRISVFPDGRFLTIPRDSTAVIWDGDSTALDTLRHRAEVVSAAISADGRQILCGLYDGGVMLWNDRGVKIDSLRHHAEVNAVQFSPREPALILSAAEDSTARLWDLSGKLQQQVARHRLGITRASYSPDGTQILTAGMDSTVALWSAADGTGIDSLRHQGDVVSAIFSPDGLQVLSASRDSTAVLWWPATREKLIFRHNGQLSRAIFSPDGRFILTIAETAATLWETEDNEKPLSILRHGGMLVNSAVFSPDGRQVLTAGDDGRVRLWSGSSGMQQDSLAAQPEGVRSAVYSPDGRWIIGASGNLVRCWQAQDLTESDSLKHPDYVESAMFAPDNRLILTTAYDNILRLWNTGGTLRDSLVHQGFITSAVFSGDSRYVLTASEDGTARLWDLQRETVTEFTHPPNVLVKSAVFSPDNQYLLTAGDDGIARAWWRPDVIYQWLKTTPAVAPLAPETRALYQVGEQNEGR